MKRHSSSKATLFLPRIARPADDVPAEWFYFRTIRELLASSGVRQLQPQRVHFVVPGELRSDGNPLKELFWLDERQNDAKWLILRLFETFDSLGEVEFRREYDTLNRVVHTRFKVADARSRPSDWRAEQHTVVLALQDGGGWGAQPYHGVAAAAESRVLTVPVKWLHTGNITALGEYLLTAIALIARRSVSGLVEPALRTSMMDSPNLVVTESFRNALVERLGSDPTQLVQEYLHLPDSLAFVDMPGYWRCSVEDRVFVYRNHELSDGKAIIKGGAWF